MLDNIDIYADTTRNQKCPCGSGKVFKKCCMKEYRAARKKEEDTNNNIKFSTFSPLLPLDYDDAELFADYYKSIIFFAHKYRIGSDFVTMEDFDNFSEFIMKERDFFYKDRDNILEEFRKKNSPNQEDEYFLEILEDAKYDMFILLEYSSETAVVVDTKGVVYNVQALTTPFDKLFPRKHLLMQTALIPYMDRYILDGHYKIIDHKLGREATKELNRLPSLGVEVNYQQEKSINLYFLTINITVSCDATRFEEMESIILHNIPDDFTQKMVDMFQHIPSEKISLASSFIRTMDFLDTVHGYTEKETRLLSGLPTSNYELNGGGSVIPYDILKIYYDQKSLDKSISEGVYQNVKNAKALVKNGEENRLYASVFYSMIGTFAINDQDIDEFRFLEDLRSERARKVFTYEIEKLFNNLEEDIDFEMYPVFLDFTLSLHDIMDEIDEFRDFMGGLFVKKNLKKMHEYSVYKDSKPNIFTKFISKK